jgi:hypothetical protein
MEVPLPWERLLWSGRPLRLGPRLRGERYVLTDFRLIRTARAGRLRGGFGAQELDELVLHDIGEVLRTETRLDRVLGTSTLVVHPRRRGTAPMVLSNIRRGAPLAALLELLSGDPQATSSAEAVRAALAWNPRPPAGSYRDAIGAVAAILIAIVAVVFGLQGKAAPIAYAADDAIEPGGVKKSRQDIVAFMEEEVMPWARVALGPLKGGADRVTCETCHAAHAEEREWHMPSVSALPLPDVLDRGWEIYNTNLDAQVRNAIYGYSAGSDNQAKAAYMRKIVMPGMARLLRRPAYDFTRTYEYNRARRSLGCYHCHRVK